jgi:RNA polymerase sigma factor (sigma-70 family)
MTDEEYEKFKRRSKHFACRCGFARYADDIAHEVITRMLEGRHESANIDQIVIDVIRSEFGRKSCISFAKRNAFNNAGSYEHGDFDRFTGTSRELRLNSRIDIERIVKRTKLTEKQRDVIHEYLNEDPTQDEIGKSLGVSASRVSQILKVSIQRMGKMVKLSKREAEVVVLVAKGLSNKEVSNRLFVTEKTVKFHLTNIYKKENVKSRAQLTIKTINGLVDMSHTDVAAIHDAPVESKPTPLDKSALPAGTITQDHLPPRIDKTVFLQMKKLKTILLEMKNTSDATAFSDAFFNAISVVDFVAEISTFEDQTDVSTDLISASV